MSHLKEALLLICLFTGYVHGLDCNFEILERNIFDHWVTTCPRLLDPEENSYCCVDVENKKSYCCTLLEFAKTTGVSLILPVAAIVIGIIFAVIGCISCFCCGCCPWYRRPQDIQTPVQVIQSPANVPPSYYTSQPTQNIPPSYTSQPTQNIPTNYTSQPTQNYVPPYPTDLTAMPQPPPYTDEAYAKQAPYNPAYLSSHLQ
ncbi:PREDICTED: protein shisa-5-like isoform X4 [Trachymyrmex septentrionalis]|uniref:protein shisa-5-like isoform X4 n=1 Tax=Trachymyrmex septentrionalis TaxID=34720 RepID=UPI00084F5A65|nr:PREDICTED: protein shisa-5-like isoform X4 [Trachymyrmex septentrionalis]